MPESRSALLALLDCFTAGGWLGLTLLLMQSCGEGPSFSPGGRWIVGGDTLIDLRSGKTQTIAPGASESLFAPNGDIIAGGRDGSLTRYCRAPIRDD